MSDNAAYQELVRVLEEAVQKGITSIGLEYQDRDLIVYHYVGNTGLGSRRIPQNLQQAVLAELIKQARLSHKSKGKFQVTLLGQDIEVRVEEYEDFGESAFRLTLKTMKKKTGR